MANEPVDTELIARFRAALATETFTPIPAAERRQVAERVSSMLNANAREGVTADATTRALLEEMTQRGIPSDAFVTAYTKAVIPVTATT